MVKTSQKPATSESRPILRIKIPKETRRDQINLLKEFLEVTKTPVGLKCTPYPDGSLTPCFGPGEFSEDE